MRRSVKASSCELAGPDAGAGALQVQRERRPQVSQRRTAAEQPAVGGTPGFTRLELIEDSEDDQEGGDEPEEEVEVEDEEEDEGEEPGALLVMTRLLQKAPEGECQWDSWLEAQRGWPRLQVALCPKFFRRGENLRVSFDVEKLGEMLQQEREERAQRKLKRAEAEEQMEHRAHEFIAEAERRRELMGGRLGGGFVLAPRSLELEETLRRGATSEEAPADLSIAPPEEKLEKPAPAPKRKKETEKKAPKEPTLQERQAAARAAEEAAEKRLAEEAAAREAKVKVLQEEVCAHRYPLWDQHISLSQPLPLLPPSAERLLQEGRAALYLLPWDLIPTAAQREALALVAELGAAEALLLLRGDEAVQAEASLTSPRAIVVVTQASASLASRTVAGGLSMHHLLVGPLPLTAATVQLLRRPVALWAEEAPEQRAAPESLAAGPSVSETFCLALKPCSPVGGVSPLAVLLEELAQEGLTVVGIRSVNLSDTTALANVSVSLRAALKPDEVALLLAVRGPHAVAIWRSMLGPSDPLLARRTDPLSLNARFGGQTRTEALAHPPPSQAARAQSDAAWAFGGRADPTSLALPSGPLSLLHFQRPRAYSISIKGPLHFAGAAALLSGLVLRAGKLISLTGDAAGGLVAVAVREGGGSFLQGCTRLLVAPPPDMAATGGGAMPGTPTTPTAILESFLEDITVEPCEVPADLGLSVAKPPATAIAVHAAVQELVQLGEPEIMVVGIRPRPFAAAPSLLMAVVDGLYTKFGVPVGARATSSSSSPSFPGLEVGRAVELLAVRGFDFDGLLDASAAADRGQALQCALDALRSFRSFAQVLRRANDDASDGWWTPRNPAEGPCGPVVLLCLRGEALTARFRTFLSKEWKLPAATAGDVLFTPDVHSTLRVYHCFFAGRGLTTFEPTVPPSDLRSLHRFEPLPARPRDAELAPEALFPPRLTQQLTAVALLQPTVDLALFRTLAAAEQHGFQLVAAFACGSQPETTLQLLFEQEVADGHLAREDWADFRSSMEGRCIWLILGRHQGVKRFAQLCGHGNPAVNQAQLHASLRCGRDKIHNGLRCATSATSAKDLLASLEADLVPRWAPAPRPRDLLLDADGAMKGFQVSLVAFSLGQGQELGLVQVLRALAHHLSEQGLTLVGLKCLTVPGTARGASSWPLHTPGFTDLLGQWAADRPSATRLVETALAGGPLLLGVAEGVLAITRSKAAVASAAAACKGEEAPHYFSASSNEAQEDVLQLFEAVSALHHTIQPSV